MRDSGINLQLPRSGQSHNLLCCCSQEWSVASLTLLLFPGVVSPITCFVVVPRSGQSCHLLCGCSQEWTVPSLALLLFPGVVSPVTCSVVVPWSGQSHHLLCCCSQEWSVPSLALLFPGVVSPITCSVVVGPSFSCSTVLFITHKHVYLTLLISDWCIASTCACTT